MTFEPSRTAALTALSRFVPHAGRDYAARRNYDLGPGRHDGVSCLSPYIRHRVLTEAEVLEAVLARHSLKAAEKFVQEVYWRTYWKGWLEMRPTVWRDYQAGLLRRLDEVQTQAGLRRAWEDACSGQTGIACFDAWAQELVQTGYLHNHARMWFASIWVFTLRLPWELGADFFLRHLLDGDPASNTLSWRWVAGLQTRGKTYLARASNISKYTEGRFSPPPGVLSGDAPALDGPPAPPRMDLPQSDGVDPSRPTALVLHAEDLNPGWLFDLGLAPVATGVLAAPSLSPLAMAPSVTEFRDGVVQETVSRWSDRLGEVTTGLTADTLHQWAASTGAEQIVTAYAPVGPVTETLTNISTLARVMRPYDRAAWPYATAGFFKFKDKIPGLVGGLKGLRAA